MSRTTWAVQVTVKINIDCHVVLVQCCACCPVLQCRVMLCFATFTVKQRALNMYYMQAAHVVGRACRGAAACHVMSVRMGADEG
jgi:hypothetical protein